jgi:pyruvate/2-oxoglutarate dehydrogenase complex dihydrolipoamide dehydrogenase (E3) component
VGCIPTKTLVASSEAIHTARRGDTFGFSVGELSVDFPKVMSRKDEVSGRIGENLTKALDKSERIDLLRDEAVFESPTRIRVGDRTVEAGKTIIAAGSVPLVPDIPGLKESGYLVNDTILELAELPEGLVVIGGGAVALEFGQMFARFGSRVTILQRRERILPRDDEEIAEALTGYLREEGIEIRTRASTRRIERENGRKVVVAEIEGRQERLPADEILVAAGRGPNGLERMNLEAAGVEYAPRGIRVDNELRTTARNIWAVGDVLGGPLYTHVAVYEAILAVENALDGAGRRMSFRAIPGAVFTDPELATVGLTEADARRMGREVKVLKNPFRYVGRARAMADMRGFVKIVVDAQTGEILGGQALGPRAGEYIHEVTVAMNSEGYKVDSILDSIFIHPTLSEGVKAAAGQWLKWAPGAE